MNKKFKFPTPVLVHEGDAILDAGEANAARINLRLPNNYLSQTRMVLDLVQHQTAQQKGEGGAIGVLTQAQEEKLDALLKLMAAVRKTAKRAYPGQDVLLRQAFQVGQPQTRTLSVVLERARIILTTAQKAENATVLATKGWLAADSTQLQNAITALDSTDDTQEKAKGDRPETTATLNATANDLYDRLLTIQNAADLEWKESDPANIAIRAAFRLGTFPPRTSGPAAAAAPQPTPPAPQP
jgi:hypothetical protein